ncbi:MAG: hypothetical protein ABEK10_02965 [Candidatus Nanosalina sp.]
MGSVSGLTAFSLIFLSLAMLLFWSVTDIGGNEVVEQQLLRFQAKEVANDIELVADYENEGYAEVQLGSNYSFGISSAGGSSPGPYTLTLGLQGNKKTVDLNVEVEQQNQPGNGMANFSTTTLCIYDDYQPRHYPSSPFSYLDYSDMFDPEDSNPSDGTVENDDPYVQFYPGECLS